MAGPTFFLSYARADAERDDAGEHELVRQFFDDLSRAIRKSTGDATAAGSFIDTKIEWGAKWEDHIHDAIRTCQVFVPLMSATYFRREWCGREWAAFEARIANNAPSRMIPVTWYPSTPPPF